MDKYIPKALAEKQELQRQQTINKVLHAIDFMMSQGIDLSTKNLMQYTGLSRSVFSKPHVRNLISEHYHAYEEASSEEKKKVSKTTSKNVKIKALKDCISRLTEENNELRNECALLRGRLFLLMQRLQE